MSDRSLRSYPPVGDPDRLDAIMGRGRSLRRRRQLMSAGAGAGGALAVVLVAVLVFGNGSGSNEGVVADDPDATTTTTTTTTVAPPAQVMEVQLLDGAPARIRVTDPAQPAGEGTQQCVTVSVYDIGTAGQGSGGEDAGSAVAEGTACAPGLSEGGTADVELRSTTAAGGDGSNGEAEVGAEVGADLGTGSPVEIGCAAVVDRPAPDAVADDRTRLGVTTFAVLATDLPAASYRVVVSAVSGIGDGCAPEQPGLERENIAETDGTLQLP